MGNSWTIEMLWECSCCGAKGNKGLERRCANCGWAKGVKDKEYFPEDISESNALTGESELDARAGKDWRCTYCNVLVRVRAKCCTNCGASKESGTQDWKHIVQTKREEMNRSYVEEELERMEVREEAKKFKGVLSSIDTSNKVFYWVIGAIGFALIMWLIIWAFVPKEVEARAKQCTWEHKTEVQRYTKVNKEGWTPNSRSLEVNYIGERLHHYNKVLVGNHRESYPESYACGENCYTIAGSCHTTPRSCTSNGNGTATCSGGNTVCSPSRQSCSTKYCTRTAYRTVNDYKDVPEYHKWYSWKEWAWVHSRTLTKSGKWLEGMSWSSDDEIRVGARNLLEGESERYSKDMNYFIDFGSTSSEEDHWEMYTKDSNKYLNWCNGVWMLKVSQLESQVLYKIK